MLNCRQPPTFGGLFHKKIAEMTIRTFSFALLLGLFAAACNNDNTSQSATTEESAAPESGAPNLSAPQGEMPAGAVSSTGTMPAAGSGQTTPAAGTSGKVNPPHGQPGHQCGIPVGAPLDSKGGASATAPTPVPAPAGAAPAPASAQPVKVAPGTNPPHGQPGHQCGIPVGAPLDSKPKN